jgi:hypothetical protein
MANANLMLHCGAQSATWEEVCNAPMPERTSTYSPVPYKDMVSMTQERNLKEFGIEIEDQEWSFGLQTRKEEGSRFFAVCRLTLEEGNEWGLAQGLRGSTDKSISNGFAAGAGVFVCDNLCFSGDSLTITRKHTGNAYQDFRGMLYMGIADSVTNFDDISKELESMKTVSCDLDRGYELIGRAMGHNVLATQETSVAISEWREPSHEEFTERNIFSLYNSFTEAAKKTRAPGAIFNKYSGIHGFFTQEVTDVVAA